MTKTIFSLKKYNRFGILFFLAMTTFLSSCKKDEETTAPPTGNNTLDSTDLNFATKATLSNLAEIELGNLALEKATNESVKSFAKMMVTDHTQATQEMASIAGRKGINLPTQSDPQHQSIKAMLQSLTGPQFDSAYMAVQVKDHEMTRDIFNVEVNQGKDADIKAFAVKYLPGIEHHLEEAISILEELDNTPEPNAVDVDFANKASISNLAEIDMSNLALEKSTNEAVRDFAQSMITDHTLAQNELQAIATTKSYDVPTVLDQPHKEIKEMLMTLEGIRFDSAYMAVQVTAHETTKANFEKEIAEGNDASLKAFAVKHLPAIMNHEMMAKEINDKL